MNGKLEHKIKIEQKLMSKLSDMPEYINKFYYFNNIKSPNTKKKYLDNVIRFLTIMGNGDVIEQEKLKSIDAYEIQKYISNISFYEKNGEIKELGESTKAFILSSLSVFFHFLKVYNYINEDPFELGIIDRPKPQEKDIIFLSPEEVRKVEKAILDGVGSQITQSRQKTWKYRDLCLFWLPVINGIRVGALSEINIEDINFNERFINVIEKGNRPVKIYYDAKAATYLKIWVDDRKKILKSCGRTNDINNGPLFISSRKTRIDVRSIERTIEKYTESAINRHISPHKLRATFATNLYNKTKDIELTSKALHHKSTVPTQKYVKVFDQDIRNAINTNLYS